ncbi:MAG: hypothetical protein NVS4B8_10040 [Herpetosiphon sp.]
MNTQAAFNGCPAGVGGDTINLPAGTYTLTIPGIAENNNATGDLDIIKPITIVGAGAAATIIKAGPGFGDRLFHITMPVAVELRGVTLQGGTATGQGRFGDGGAIYNEGALVIADSVVTGNTAVNEGGGIASAGSTLRLVNTTVDSNSAAVNGGGIAFASATMDPGKLIELFVTNNSTISNNTAGMQGGGIIDLNRGMLLQDSRVVNNRVTGAKSQGGGVGNFLGWGSIERSRVEGNKADQGGGVATGGDFAIIDSEIVGNTARLGGGIGNALQLTLRGSTVRDNEATELGGGLGNDSGYAFGPGTATVENTTFANNRAARGGGIATAGTFSMTGGVIRNNTATTRGGGVSIGNGTATFNGTQILNNGAPTGGGVFQAFDTTYGTTKTSSQLIGLAVSGNQGQGVTLISGDMSISGSSLTSNVPGNCGLTGGNATSGGNNVSSDGSCSTVFTASSDKNSVAAVPKRTFLPLVLR